MNQTRGSLICVAIIGVIVACGGTLEPFQSIELRTEVAPAAVAVGDTVTLRAIMRNPSNTAIETGLACGPPVLFEIRHAAGDLVHPIPLDGVFTCPFLDYHLLEPHETDTVTIRWRVDLRSGDWSVRSGFRRAAGLEDLTHPARLRVK